MEILSISPGDGHEWLGECDSISSSINDDNNKDNASFCNEIEGTVMIGFDQTIYPESGPGASDFKSVGDLVLSRIQEDMIRGNYLEKVNTDLLEFDVAITKMKYIDSDYLDLVDQNVFAPLNTNSASSSSPEADASLAAVGQTDMTLFAKVAIPIMAVLFVLAMGFCWCAMSSCPTELFFEKKERAKKDNTGKDISTLDKPEYVKTHPRNISMRSSTRDVHPKSGRDARLSSSQNNKERDNREDFISTSIRSSSNNNTDKSNSKHNDNDENDFCTPSLEATLQDLSETELMKYGVQGARGGPAPYNMSTGNRKTYSTLPLRKSRSRGANRFLPITVRPRSQSMIHVVDGTSTAHPSDSDTGSSTYSVSINDEMNNSKDHHSDSVEESVKVDFVKVGDPGYEADGSTTPFEKKMPPSSRGVFSSFFNKSSSCSSNNNNEADRNPSPVINLVDRVNGCTSINNQCFRDTEELPAPAKNNKNSKGTVLRYVIPADGRCNSLLEVNEAPPPPGVSTTAAKSSSARMSTKKSKAYKEYINKKMMQREEECEQLDAPIPMQIGVKRTFTDERGRIRVMVAL